MAFLLPLLEFILQPLLKFFKQRFAGHAAGGVVMSPRLQIMQEIWEELGDRPTSIERDAVQQTVTLRSAQRALRFSEQQLRTNPALDAAIRSYLADLVSANERRAAFAQKKKTEDKAWKLLVRRLSNAQRAELVVNGSFMVIGGETGGHYRINRGAFSNIDVLDSQGVVLEKLCVVPDSADCLGDIMLAQKIGLECFESVVLARAVRSVVTLYGTMEEYQEGDWLYAEPRRAPERGVFTGRFSARNPATSQEPRAG